MRPSPDFEPEPKDERTFDTDIPHVDAPLTRSNTHHAGEAIQIPTTAEQLISLEGLRALGKAKLSKQPEVLAMTEADATEPSHDPDDVSEPSSNGDPRSFEEEVPSGEHASAAGGGPNKPPTEPPVCGGATDPGEAEDPKESWSEPGGGEFDEPNGLTMEQPNVSFPNAETMRPVDRYQREFRNLVDVVRQKLQYDEGCMATARTHTIGTVVNGAYDFEVVHASSGSEEELAEECRQAEDLAYESISELETEARVDGTPGDGHSADYYVDERIAYGEGVAYVGIQTVSRLVGDQCGEELMTVTTVMIPEDEQGQELVHACVCSKGEQVMRAGMSAIPAQDMPYQREWRKMFGGHGVLSSVMQGKFSTPEEADAMLEPFIQNANEMGVYPPEAIALTVDHVKQMGLAAQADQAVDNGIRPDRLARLQQYVTTTL